MSLASWKRPSRAVPSAPTATKITRAIKEAISAYSTAVAPLSCLERIAGLPQTWPRGSPIGLPRALSWSAQEGSAVERAGDALENTVEVGANSSDRDNDDDGDEGDHQPILDSGRAVLAVLELDDGLQHEAVLSRWVA